MPYLFFDRSRAPGSQSYAARLACGFVTDNSISGRGIPSSGERRFAQTGFFAPFQRLPDSVFFRAAVFGRAPLGRAWSKQ